MDFDIETGPAVVLLGILLEAWTLNTFHSKQQRLLKILTAGVALLSTTINSKSAYPPTWTECLERASQRRTNGNILHRGRKCWCICISIWEIFWECFQWHRINTLKWERQINTTGYDFIICFVLFWFSLHIACTMYIFLLDVALDNHVLTLWMLTNKTT